LLDPRGLNHALYVFTPPLSTLPHTTRNERILVVGGGDTAHGFMASLLPTPAPHATLAAGAAALIREVPILPHLTLITPQWFTGGGGGGGGYGGPPCCDPYAPPAPFSISAGHREASLHTLARTPIPAHFPAICGDLVGLSRKERTITLLQPTTHSHPLQHGGQQQQQQQQQQREGRQHQEGGVLGMTLSSTNLSASSFSSSTFSAPPPTPTLTTLRFDRLVLLPELLECTWARLGYASPSDAPAGCFFLGCTPPPHHTPLEEAVALTALRLSSASTATSELEPSLSFHPHHHASSSSSSPSPFMISGELVGEGGGSGELPHMQHLVHHTDGTEGVGADTHHQHHPHHPHHSHHHRFSPPRKGSVLVYGDTLEAVAALTALLDRGIPATSIVHLLPPPKHHHHPSGACEVTPATLASALAAAGLPPSTAATIHPHNLIAGLIPTPTPTSTLTSGHSSSFTPTPASLFPAITTARALTAAGVRTIAGVTLLDVSRPADGSASHVVVTIGLGVGSGHQQQQQGEGGGGWTVHASLLLCGDEKEVDPRFFSAVNDGGLVFDGRLVVDGGYGAGGEGIFGGGPCTRFTRALRGKGVVVNEGELGEVSPGEVGAGVAGALLLSLELQHSHDHDGDTEYQATHRGETAREAALQRLESSKLKGASGSSSSKALGGGAASSSSLSPAPVSLPRLTKPRVHRCTLPGGIIYYRARLAAFEMGGSGKEIVTYTGGDNGDFRHT
jgi:hypothetical protein